MNGIRDNMSPMKTLPQFQKIDFIGMPKKINQIFNSAGNESISQNGSNQNLLNFTGADNERSTSPLLRIEDRRSMSNN